MHKLEIKKYNPVDHKIKALIYGASGVGKTYFAGTSPNAIFASAEDGLLSVAGKNVHFAQIKSLKDLQSLHQFLAMEDHQFETVVIDSITEINEVIKMEIEKKNNRIVQKNDWIEVQSKIRAIFRAFRDLPMHVIFIAQEKELRDDESIVKMVPLLNGKAATEMAYFMDIVGYVIKEKDGTRRIITESHNRFLTKDRSQRISSDLEPDFTEWIKAIGEMEIGEQKTITEFKTADVGSTPDDELKTAWAGYVRAAKIKKADQKDAYQNYVKKIIGDKAFDKNMKLEVADRLRINTQEILDNPDPKAEEKEEEKPEPEEKKEEENTPTPSPLIDQLVENVGKSNLEGLENIEKYATDGLFGKLSVADQKSLLEAIGIRRKELEEKDKEENKE